MQSRLLCGLRNILRIPDIRSGTRRKRFLLPTTHQPQTAYRHRGLPSHVYALRIGPIQTLPAIVAELGCDPATVFAKAGVDVRLFERPNNLISVDELGRLLQTCVADTACPYFGLLIGQRFDTTMLGEIGALMRNSPTVGKACRNLTLHLHLQDRGAVPLLIHVSSRHVALGYSMLRYETEAIRQFHEGVVAIMYCIMRELCGPAWKPLEARFSHSRPADLMPYRQFFGARLQFDADFSAIVFPREWLDHPLAGADPVLYDQLCVTMAGIEDSQHHLLAGKVRRALQSMVFSGTASSEGIARLFDLHERALRRRLETEGTSAHQLIQETLFAVARQLLRETQLNVSEIAAALHYGDTAAFSNAFRRWAGQPPSKWRQLAWENPDGSTTLS